MADSNPTTERWLPVVGYEGIYEVSDLGRVRSVARTVPYRYRMTSVICYRRIPAKTISQIVNVAVGGRLYVNLRKETVKMVTVHRLVALAFVPNPNALPEVNHIDANKTNNAASNLEWCTRIQNARHAARLGLFTSGEQHWTRTHPERVRRGERAPNSTLTESDVLAIRQACREGIPQHVTGERFHCSTQHVCTIHKRHCWKHLP